MTSVVVTGAASGIGRAVALRLLDEGWSVVALDRDAQGLAELTNSAASRSASLTVVQGDVQTPETHEIARSVAKESGPLRAWVAVAGITRSHKVTALDPNSVREMIDINQMGSLWSASSAVREFLETGSGGVFVGISSVHASRAAEHYPVYEMTKAAVEALVRSVAVSYARSGIRAVCIAPGAVWTPALRDTIGEAVATGVNVRQLESSTPMGRIADPDEVASVVSFVISTAASYISGTTIHVDGAWTGALMQTHDEDAEPGVRA